MSNMWQEKRGRTKTWKKRLSGQNIGLKTMDALNRAMWRDEVQ